MCIYEVFARFPTVDMTHVHRSDGRTDGHIKDLKKDVGEWNHVLTEKSSSTGIQGARAETQEHQHTFEIVCVRAFLWGLQVEVLKNAE